jgi:tRNA (cytidine/uridine-2'-O-)-methyltransferase
MRRAGLDYREFAQVRVYSTLEDFRRDNGQPRLFGATTNATRPYHDVSYRRGDAILFGPETRGLPANILSSLGDAGQIRIPMRPESRSLNLSNATAVVVYEALRQLDFPGLA